MARGEQRAPRHLAIHCSFLINGFAFASWAARIPDVRHQLGLSAPSLGLLLLAMSIGSVLSLSCSGWVVHRFGVRNALRGGASLVVLGLLGVTVGVGADNAGITAVALFGYGLGTGVWDVAMNVEAAEAERLDGRPIMARFHASFSLGTVMGALIGALASRLSPHVAWHLPVVAMAVLAIAMASVARFSEPAEPGTASSGAARAWRERRTLMIGLVVLAMALAEGIANDWLALALQDGYRVARPVAVLGYALFVVSMTAGRFAGPGLLHRHGRVRTLAVTVVAAAVGLLLVVFGGRLAVAGILLWGFGASLGFPVGVSAAADDPARAPARVSVVTTIGYGAFFIGPPLVGGLAGQVGTLHALLVLLVALVVAAALVPSTRAAT